MWHEQQDFVKAKDRLSEWMRKLIKIEDGGRERDRDRKRKRDGEREREIDFFLVEKIKRDSMTTSRSFLWVQCNVKKSFTSKKSSLIFSVSSEYIFT